MTKHREYLEALRYLSEQPFVSVGLRLKISNKLRCMASDAHTADEWESVLRPIDDVFPQVKIAQKIDTILLDADREFLESLV